MWIRVAGMFTVHWIYNSRYFFSYSISNVVICTKCTDIHYLVFNFFQNYNNFFDEIFITVNSLLASLQQFHWQLDWQDHWAQVSQQDYCTLAHNYLLVFNCLFCFIHYSFHFFNGHNLFLKKGRIEKYCWNNIRTFEDKKIWHPLGMRLLDTNKNYKLFMISWVYIYSWFYFLWCTYLMQLVKALISFLQSFCYLYLYLCKFDILSHLFQVF